MIGGTKIIKSIQQDESWFYDSFQKRAFIGAAIEGPVAAQYPHVQLWNPAASGKILACTKIIAGILTGTPRLSIRYYNTELTTGWQEGNKYLAEAAGAGALRGETNVAMLGNEIGQFLLDGVNQPYIEIDLQNSPILIHEDFGLHVLSTTVNLTLTALFEWIEVPI